MNDDKDIYYTVLKTEIIEKIPSPEALGIYIYIIVYHRKWMIIGTIDLDQVAKHFNITDKEFDKYFNELDELGLLEEYKSKG